MVAFDLHTIWSPVVGEVVVARPFAFYRAEVSAHGGMLLATTGEERGAQ
jgi:hypothetical protein